MSLSTAKYYAKNGNLEKVVYELCKEIDELNHKVSRLKSDVSHLESK